MPQIIPEPRYFSIPSIVVGAVALRNEALNWTPWVRSLIQPPLAWTNSPAEIIAAWPMTVIGSRWPRALTRSTQNPLSELWNVTRSTRPAKTSVELTIGVRTIRHIMNTEIRRCYSNAGEICADGEPVTRLRQKTRFARLGSAC